jgi:hypothetical protein
MTWKRIDGRGMDVPQFRAHVATLQFTTWRPSFMTLHNTAAPTLEQWKAYPAEKRIRNLEAYYRDQMGWSAGPHAFVAHDKIWLFTPFTTPGVHTPSWNGTALGIELVGDYAREDDDRGDGFKAKMNCVAVFGELHMKLGLNPETIRLHKEDTRTDHDCPGKDIEKSEFIELVRQYMGQAGEHPPTIPIFDQPAPKSEQDVPAAPEGVVLDSVGDLGLNLRVGSSAASKIAAVLPKGARFAVVGEAMNGTTRWLRIWCRNKGVARVGWVAARYVKLPA